MEKLLILGYKFYGYENEIVEEASKKYDVNFIDYEPNLIIRIFFKVLACLKINLLEYYLEYKLKKQINKYKSIDKLLVIGGHYLSYSLLNNTFKKIEKLEKILYLWDDIERVKSFKDIRSFFDKILTFDLENAKEYSLEFRPTFYSNRLKKIKERNKYKMIFIGIFRKNRLELLQDVNRKYNFIYLYHNIVTFYIFKILGKEEYKKISYKHINFKKIKKEKYNELLQQSFSLLDINFKKQTGLTQRVLDALYLEKKIITTNLHVKNYDFYKKNNIFIIKKSINEVPSSFLETPYEKINEEIIKKYSCKSFLEEILKSD